MTSCETREATIDFGLCHYEPEFTVDTIRRLLDEHKIVVEASHVFDPLWVIGSNYHRDSGLASTQLVADYRANLVDLDEQDASYMWYSYRQLWRLIPPSWTVVSLLRQFEQLDAGVYWVHQGTVRVPTTGTSLVPDHRLLAYIDIGIEKEGNYRALSLKMYDGYAPSTSFPSDDFWILSAERSTALNAITKKCILQAGKNERCWPWT